MSRKTLALATMLPAAMLAFVWLPLPIELAYGTADVNHIGTLVSPSAVFFVLIFAASYAPLRWLDHTTGLMDESKWPSLRAVGLGIIGTCFIAGCLGAWQSVTIGREKQAQVDVIKAARTAAAAREAALTPEQRAARDAIRDRNFALAASAASADAAAKAASALEARAQQVTDGLVLRAVQTLKRSALDPDTFEIKEATAMNNGAACLSYRAHNAFNAMLLKHAVAYFSNSDFKILIESQDGDLFVAQWNQRCTGNQRGREIAYLVQAYLGRDQ